jgi:cell division protein ZapA (FtsZ GTPase activity inhibitor)
MNITTIIPIHEYNEKIATLLDKAIESVQKQEGISELPQVIVIYAFSIQDEMLKYHQNLTEKYPSGITNVSFSANDGKTDYQSQVNFGVKKITTDYFSVLEFDDEYGTTFFKNAEKYIKAYPEIDVFLTMMIEVNEKNEGIKMTNETVWAQQFVGENGEMGYLNTKALQQYTDFKLSGAVIKKSEFENLGGYKSNIKLTFMYEFLLRALNNACKIFSIPKIAYKHLATREGSLFDTYLKTMPVNERKFWFETANKEANIMGDRAIDMSRLPK